MSELFRSELLERLNAAYDGMKGLPDTDHAAGVLQGMRMCISIVREAYSPAFGGVPNRPSKPTYPTPSIDTQGNETLETIK